MRIYIPRDRITPACAGKTTGAVIYICDGEDHPRVCGENCGLVGSLEGTTGSPPRVRGKRIVLSAEKAASRITPACAGKTGSSRSQHSYTRGSPPRVRGKPLVEVAQELRLRITPACAGKTTQCTEGITARKDHPRVCGENPSGSKTAKCGRGSPPRVRGKPVPAHTAISIHRITPACAGKTLAEKRDALFREDHPRVCGENAIAFRGRLVTKGSPPRVRGKQSLRYPHRPLLRITPACAGKTSGNRYFCPAP